jgi:hypothetical protein
MLLAQDSAPGLGLWSLGLSALWSAALLAQSGEDRFGDRRIVLAHAGSIIPSTGIVGITPVDGFITNSRLLAHARRTNYRIEEDGDNNVSIDTASTGAGSRHTFVDRRLCLGV